MTGSDLVNFIIDKGKKHLTRQDAKCLLQKMMDNVVFVPVPYNTLSDFEDSENAFYRFIVSGDFIKSFTTI